jgi:CubicO group peptidase (beta-lactamase class C family)
VKLAAVRRKLERVDRAVTRAIERGELPGAVVLAKQGDLLCYEGVFGSAALAPERRETRPDTIYDLASLTKVMATTSAVMLLVAEGKIRLDQPVADFLPEFAAHGKEKVTVRHLLTHSSGLRPWRAYYDDLREREQRKGERLLGTPEGRESIVRRILQTVLVHEPGEAAVYGDLGFIVLGELVERVSGASLDHFCGSKIFQPLGMGDTRFNPVPYTGDPSPYAATELCPWRERVLTGEVHDGNAWAMGGVAGHAGLFATAADVMRFGEEILAAAQGQSEIFPAEVAGDFLRPQELPAGSDWALGWATPTPGQSTSGTQFSPRSVGHTGFTGTSLWIDLERGTIVVLLSNRVHTVAKRSRFALRPAVHDLIVEAFGAA